MHQAFVIIRNIEFSGNELREGRVKAYDRSFWLTCDINVQAITHQFIRGAIANFRNNPDNQDHQKWQLTIK